MPEPCGCRETLTEAPLAGPFSPITLAIGAAAATGIIVLGVVAGPGTVTCIQRGDFATCMSETFFGDGPTQIAESETTKDVAALADAPAVETTEQPSVDAAQEPTDDATVGVNETATSVSQAVLPSFAIVRVEPDGSAVIAGSASPSGQVRIFADDTEIGSETAGPSGDFAFVTEDPLPTGGVELRVLDVETDTYADTSVVVVVQDDRTSEPLVVASEPGEASEILQGLEAPATEAEPPVEEPVAVAEAETSAEPEAAEPMAVAESEAAVETREAEPMVVAVAPATDPAPAEAVEAEPIPGAPAVNIEAPTPAEPAAETPGTPAAQTAIIAPAEPASGAVTPQVDMPSPVEQASTEVAPEAPAPQVPAAPMAAAVTEPQQEAVVEAAPAVPEPNAPADDAAPQEIAATAEPVEAIETAEPEAPAEPEQVAASQEPAEPLAPAATATPELNIVQPTIDAVEIDGDRNFFAGAGTDGMIVRLYVDNELVGTTEVVDGRWLVESIGQLDQQNQRVRIDMLAADGTVVGRAEVDFVLELPEAVEEEIAVAAADPDESAEPATQAAATQGSQTQEFASDVPAEPAMSPEPATSELEAPQDLASSEPATAAQPEPVQAPEQEQPNEPASSDTESTPAASEPADDSVPTLVGVTEGDRTTSGLAIIRRGDNLWTIARRVYGAGIRYTQIYEANTDQIRDPDLIYPGQVFDLPDTDQIIGRDGETAEITQ